MINHMEIAQTIHAQIRTMDPVALMAWGAKEFAALGEKPVGTRTGLAGLRFKVNGMKHKGYVEVMLMPSDTYTVRIFSIRAGKVKEKGMADDVYAEDLAGLIDFMVER